MSTKIEEKKSQLRIEGSPSVPCQIHAQKAFLELTSYRRVSLILRISTSSQRKKITQPILPDVLQNYNYGRYGPLNLHLESSDLRKVAN